MITFRYWIGGEEDIFLDPTCCALAFRILRLHGYDVSSGCLNYCVLIILSSLSEKDEKFISLLSCVDPFNQYTEDKFSKSLKGYLKDAGAVFELYKASQIMIHPGEEVLVKQNAWTRHFLRQELSPDLVHVDRLFSQVEQEVFSYNNPLYNLVQCFSAIYHTC